MATRILLVDDHLIIRDGLRSAFEKQSDMAIVGEAAEGQAAIALARDLRPDVVIMDLSLPGLNGIEATRLINAACPGARVIALSVRCDKQTIGETFKAGAVGYLPKECTFRELLVAVRTTMGGLMYLSPAVADTVVEGFVRHNSPPQPSAFQNLTAKERQVLQGVAEGQSTKEIATVLGISVKTVDSHRQEIMRRLNLHSAAELTKYAIREGITSL